MTFFKYSSIDKWGGGGGRAAKNDQTRNSGSYDFRIVEYK